MNTSNCIDCGTPLKHLFGQKWYCPNDCDLLMPKEAPLEYEISWVPMWDLPKRVYTNFKPGSVSTFHTDENYAGYKLVEYIVKSGSYAQKVLGDCIHIHNISNTKDLIVVEK